MEIDLEILDMLMANASAKTEKWSAKVGYELNSSNTHLNNQVVSQTLTLKELGSKHLETKYKQFLTLSTRKL